MRVVPDPMVETAKPDLSNHQTDILGLFNPAQTLELERIRITSYDRLSGFQVWKDLLQHKDLWHAARMVNHDPDEKLNGLRALEFGDTHGRDLMISTRTPLMESLGKLADGWCHDSAVWLDQWEMDVMEDMPKDYQVLMVSWWADGRSSNPESWAGDTMGGGIPR